MAYSISDPVLPDQAGRVMSINPQVTREQVLRQVAYQIYESRGREDGHALDDWLAAEAVMKADWRRAA